ncbi:MAG: hypothetical protein RIB58_00040 [Phycisphaerales bacterium]
MTRVWLSLLVLALLVRGAAASLPQQSHRDELLQRLPASVDGALSIENAAALRNEEAGRAIVQWMRLYQALPQTQRAWGLLADRLGLSAEEAFDRILGGSAVLAFSQHEVDAPAEWIILAAVDARVSALLVRRTGAVPRQIVHGRNVLGLEEESFLLSNLAPLADGRQVLAIAPAGSRRLLSETLEAAADKAPALPEALLGSAPPEATVRGFWRPSAADHPPGSIAAELRRWLWRDFEPGRALACWASFHGSGVAIEFGSAWAEGSPDRLPPAPAAEGVLLDIIAPGDAIVAGVLERTGLLALVPKGLTATEHTGELIVRRSGEGVDLGARLPIEPGEASTALSGPTTPGTRLVRVRDLTETPSSRVIFGSSPAQAWAIVDRPPQGVELVFAVVGGAGAARPTQPEARAVAIVLEAADRAGPSTPGMSGTARPHELWQLLRSTVVPERDQAAEQPGFASLAALVDRARWTIRAEPAGVDGRVVLELRKGGAK